MSHDPRAAGYADRVVLLGDGKIVGHISFNDQADAAQRLRMIMDTLEELQL